MDEILKMVASVSGLAPEKLAPVVRAVLGFLRSKLPAGAVDRFDGAVAAPAASFPTEPAAVTREAEAAGLSVGQLKSIVDTVLGFLKDKLPPDVVTRLGGEVAALVGGGGLLKRLVGMFTGAK